MIGNQEEMEIPKFTKVFWQIWKLEKPLNDQSKDELLTPNIEKVVVFQRLLVGHRDSVPSKGLVSWLVLGILSCPKVW